MEQALLDFGMKEGLFAALFIWLLYSTMKRSEEREDKLYSFLDGMKDEFAKLVESYASLADDVAEIRDDLHATKTHIKLQSDKTEETENVN
jgi:hypothetical protein